MVVTDQPGEIFARRRLAGRRHSARPALLDLLQRELREVKGVSALIYDQTCAAELHRKRKRDRSRRRTSAS